MLEYGGLSAPDSALVRIEAEVLRARLKDVIEASPGAVLHVELERSRIDPGTVPARPWSPWPVARKMPAEARDRLRPILDR